MLALLSAQPVTWTVSLLAAALVPRYLGDEALGQYVAAVSIAGLAGMVATMGVPTYLLRLTATQPERVTAVGTAAFVLLVVVAFVAAVGVATALPLFGLGAGYESVLRLALAGMVLTTAQSVPQALLVGRQRLGRFAWLNAAGAVIGTGAGIAVLIAGGDVVAFTLAGLVVSGVMLGATLSASGLRFRASGLSPTLWVELARSGLPFLGWDAARQTYGEVDRILLAALSRQSVLGWYAAAYRIISIPVFIPSLIVTPLYPALCRQASNPPVFQHMVRRSTIASLLLMVPASAAIVALAPVIPGLLGWSESFQNSVPLMVVLALSMPVVGADMVLAVALSALRRERVWLFVAVAAAVANPAGNALLIPLFERTMGNGAIGAAVMTLLTELLMMGGALWLLPRGIFDRATVWTGACVVMAGGCLAAVTIVLRPVFLPLAIVAGGSVYLVLALLLGAVRRDDLNALRLGVIRALPFPRRVPVW
jgi:O-antigen/teichoic acid export membrane protein